MGVTASNTYVWLNEMYNLDMYLTHVRLIGQAKQASTHTCLIEIVVYITERDMKHYVVRGATFRDVMYGQIFGAEMSMRLLTPTIGKNNFSKRNRTTILDLDNRELQKQETQRGGTERLRK